MDHPLDLRCHPLQFVCSPFEVEGEGVLIGEVMVEMVGEVLVEMVREVVVHLSRHCLPPYPPPPPYLPITRYFHTSLYLHITRYFYTPQAYTSPSIPPQTYTSLPSPMSLDPASMRVNMTLSSHPLSSPTLSPIDETMVDLVSEFGARPTKRPRAPRIRQVLHPSAPLAPLAPSASSASSAPFEIARDPIDKLAMYSRRRPKRNIKTPSCGTH